VEKHVFFLLFFVSKLYPRLLVYVCVCAEIQSHAFLHFQPFQCQRQTNKQANTIIFDEEMSGGELLEIRLLDKF